MSGQPVKKPSDANRFRNEYMQTLALQEAINDMNLQANKTYLLTGQLPPQSQMQDTRTNAEKLADVEKMKQQIVEALRPIAEPQFAYAIVNKIIDSPLNLDNTLFRFLAQKVDSIVEHLKKIIKVGIRGDANDLERIVEFISDMYAKQQGSFQSTKSYMNSMGTEASRSKIISSNDIDIVISQIQDIIKQLHILTGFNNEIVGILDDLIINLQLLRNVLPSTDEISYFLNLLSTNSPLLMDLNTSIIKDFYGFLEDLPKYSQVTALINKVKTYIKSKSFDTARDGIKRLENLFVSVMNIVNSGMYVKFQNFTKLIRDLMTGRQPQQPQQQAPPQADQQAGFQLGAPPPPQQQAPPPPAQQREPPMYRNQPMNDFFRDLTEDELDNIIAQINIRFPNYYALDRINNAVGRDNKERQIRRLMTYPNAGYAQGDPAHNFGIYGLGFKKRRGRPRGSGIAKVEKPPTFIGFGINEINQRKLNDGILKIRRNTRTSFQDMPSKRISPTLQRIIKTVVGGGMPNYNDLSSLNEEEKEYLHKIVTRSNMEDKLSIPAPSKDQQEKDIHNFEVMKGQIMSGNDSIELVKKFKLLIRKLAKQGLLPKNDVEDIMDTLMDLGY